MECDFIIYKLVICCFCGITSDVDKHTVTDFNKGKLLNKSFSLTMIKISLPQTLNCFPSSVTPH